MKPLLILLLASALTTPLHAIDADQLAAVSKKFSDKSGDVQYQARLELNRLVDEATAPGKNQQAEVNRLLIAALASEQIPHEAKKYILRVLSKVGTPTEVPALNSLLNGPDALFKEEARRALERIPGPESIAALQQALGKASDPRTQIGLINSLAIHRADSAVDDIQALIFKPELARSAITALGKIGSPKALASLKKAYASDSIDATNKGNIARALLDSGKLDSATLALIQNSATSDRILRLAAFQALVAGQLTAEKSAAIEDALKSEDPALRQAAIRQALVSNLPSLRLGLIHTIEKFSSDDRLVVLANIHHLKPSKTAEEIAITCLATSEESERIAALKALAKIDTQAAFETVLQALAAREPRIKQTAGSMLAEMDYPEGEALIIGMLKSDSSDQRVLGIKAVAYRQIPEVNLLLLGIIKSGDQAATREALKVIYTTASLQDLNDLCASAQSAEDEKQRAILSSVCKKIAARINSDEARRIIAPLK